MAKITLEKVCFTYNAHGRTFEALKDVDLEIGDGEFVCIVGRSGCGKTTLLRLIAGLQLPTSGKILLDGQPITGPGTDRAVVFQNYTLFPWMKAQRNIEFGVRQANKKLTKQEASEIAKEFLAKVGMADAADKYPCELSGGMKQRVAIARALAMDTDILLLDEPFGALDARIRSELQKLLEHLWDDSGRKKTVIFVTHDIKEAALLADRVIYMVPGGIASDVPIPLPHFREDLEPCDAAELTRLRRELLALFYQNSGMEDGEDE